MNLSKEEMVYSALAGLAKRIGPNGKLPRVKDLCSKLTVSRSTLDRVLRQLEKDRILVCRHGTGIFVSPYCNQRRIALVFGGDIHDSLRYSQFWSLIHGSVLRHAERYGDDLHTYYGCPTADVDREDSATFALREGLEGRKIGGLLTAALAGPASYQWLKSWSIPLVSLGDGAGVSDAAVEVEPMGSFQKALGLFKEWGCRRVALVWSGSPEADYQAQTDSMSVMFRECLEKVGLPYDPDLRWVPSRIPQGPSWQTFEEAGGALLRALWADRTSSKKVDAVFFMDDTMAHGGLISLLEKGVKIGRDVQVGVMSAKGVSLLRPFWPTIIRVESDPDEIVSQMFTALGRLFQGLRLPARVHKAPAALVLPTGDSLQDKSIRRT